MSRSSRAKTSARARRAALIAATVLGALLVLLAAVTVILTVLSARFAATQRFASQVHIAGLPVAGLTPSEAFELLQREYVPTLPEQLTLTYPNGKFQFTREKLGYEPDLEEALAQALQLGREPHWLDRLRTHLRLRVSGADLPVHMKVDPEHINQAISKLAPQINRPPRDAQVTVEGEELTKVPGRAGLELSVDESVRQVTDSLFQGHLESLALVVRETPPNITDEDLAGLQKVLGHFSTPYRPHERDRTHNMRLAMAPVNGTLLQPDQDFSLNQRVGRRTVEAGYRNAPIFRDGEVVPDIGGGICQVATTLYNAALLANLQILQRSSHSRVVWYCPSGRDAAVYWGQLDLRFKNSLKHPILLLGEIRGSRLHAWVVGHADDDYEVELIRSDVTTIAHSKRVIEDPTLPEGTTQVEVEGHNGARATLTRRVSRDGQVISTRVMNRDYYRPQTRVVRVGTKPKEPPAPAAPAPGESGPALQSGAAAPGAPPASRSGGAGAQPRTEGGG